MTVRYQIWLKGWLHNEVTVEIPEHDDRLSFSENVEYREQLLALEERKLFTLYQRKMAKADGRVQVCYLLPSRIGNFMVDDENELYAKSLTEGNI